MQTSSSFVIFIEQIAAAPSWGQGPGLRREQDDQ